MKNFCKYAAFLMTAAMAAGMLTSCQDKDDTGPEEEPVTIRKVWLAKFIDEDTEEESYSGHDFAMIDGTYHYIDYKEGFVEQLNEKYELDLPVTAMPYISIGENLTLEIVETDATSGTITVADEKITYWQFSYKNLTRDSVIIFGEEDGETFEMEYRTPEGWGLTITGYVDITPYI